MSARKVSPLMLLPPLLFAGLAALFLIGMQRQNPDELPSALVGQQAPTAEMTPLADKPMWDDAALRRGQPTLVNFWASWCGPCRVEHPNLMQLQQEGLAVLGVNYKDMQGNALSFLKELGDPYEAVGADSAGRMALNWGVYGVPETYLIDGQGNVVLRIAGPVTQREIDERLRPALESLK
ncbi:DsbE family thiol:disulfide interchange protein [Shimia sp. R10_1]|uniref:DsbE family thiol:disulfide interchange protein n=1 Tax=Shimia sp. R10_1 TaxID=2821095 RepID=UPI001FFDF413|nr:DsbE family thiol:disulfide interchange protein [Shimia sp. R10_1]